MLERVYCEGFRTKCAKKLRFVRNEIRRCPAGTLKASKSYKNGKIYTRFYILSYKNGERKRFAIGRKPELLERYANKAFLEELARRLAHNYNLLEACAEGMLQEDCESILEGMDQDIAKYVAERKVLGYEAITNAWSDVDVEERIKNPGWDARLEDMIEAWRNADYVKYDQYPENLCHRTSRGIYVRSKSELSIAEILYRYGIAFRYEAEIEINGVMLHPDFTVMRADGTLMYWEHFGLMNDHEYVRVMKRKLEMYEQAGIVPWRNLIVTYDTNDGTLDLAIIESEIKNKILCR